MGRTKIRHQTQEKKEKEMTPLINPKGQALRKWMLDLLGDRYPKHDQLLERLGYMLMTNQDLQDFGKMSIDLYEIGYLKCLADYKTKLDKLGIKVQMTTERPPIEN